MRILDSGWCASRSCLLQRERAGSMEQLPPFLQAIARALNITHVRDNAGGIPTEGHTADAIALAATSAQQPSIAGISASAGVNAFTLLRQSGVRSSTAGSNQPGRGKGRGGAGGTKSCVPCTMIKYSLSSAAEARCHSKAVLMNRDHQRPPAMGGCQICKCTGCKKNWNRDHVVSHDFTTAVECKESKHYIQK